MKCQVAIVLLIAALAFGAEQKSEEARGKRSAYLTYPYAAAYSSYPYYSAPYAYNPYYSAAYVASPYTSAAYVSSPYTAAYTYFK
ncbi:hypothetical protein J6590_002000 [Homalodisca vitripennis]|nr:hypothetical protein J6590_002000 [Homalodisca vitripennis]